MSWRHDQSARRDLAACPAVAPSEVNSIAERAQTDAMDLAMDVRDLDPRVAWGRLVRWGRQDPPRLVAACVALAAMVPVDRPVSELLAWTDWVATVREVTG